MLIGCAGDERESRERGMEKRDDLARRVKLRVSSSRHACLTVVLVFFFESKFFFGTAVRVLDERAHGLGLALKTETGRRSEKKKGREYRVKKESRRRRTKKNEGNYKGRKARK